MLEVNKRIILKLRRGSYDFCDWRLLLFCFLNHYSVYFCSFLNYFYSLYSSYTPPTIGFSPALSSSKRSLGSPCKLNESYGLSDAQKQSHPILSWNLVLYYIQLLIAENNSQAIHFYLVHPQAVLDIS